MTPDQLIPELSRNGGVYLSMLGGVRDEMVVWRKEVGAWCLLEIVCHLLDEEREDFRARIRHTLEQPKMPLLPIDPVGWVITRDYIHQDYDKVLDQFLHEREASATWLRSLKNPPWLNYSIHPVYGKISAEKFLCNWLAHDYHHIRQINQLKYQFLRSTNSADLSYAGNW